MIDFSDFFRYIELEYNPIEDSNCSINFNQSFCTLSVSGGRNLELLWKKFGFRHFFKKYIFWFNLCRKKFSSAQPVQFWADEKPVFSKNLKPDEMLTHFEKVKICKNSGRLIGLVEGNDNWIDLMNYLSPIWYYQDIPHWVGFRFLPFDKNFSNLSPENLAPVPKGMTLKQLYDATYCQTRFQSPIQFELETLSLPEIYKMMINQSDKVWLNHNVVCIIFDKFVFPFIKNTETLNNSDNKVKYLKNKSHYLVLNEYAKKFGFFPTLDRLVLTFWKFKVSIYAKIIFLISSLKNEFKILEPTSIRL